MQLATSETALGDFNDSEFELNGVTSRFYTRENSLYVETDGSDGEMANFPVRYTFGVYPLQQYLVELPDGKIQALSIAWDTRPPGAGGQRWFHLYGDDPIDHTDVLHWTKLSQSWETMCADCHSTGLISQYDLDNDQFKTSFEEINVACEACHGPGGNHVAWAQDQDSSTMPDKGLSPVFNERKNISWQLDAATGNSTRSSARTSSNEINTCAPCHSRRMRLSDAADAATPFLDAYSPALIETPLYHADGQILDEVYVYGSFLQSKMHQKGVTCSDCHDPHSLELRAPGPAVCLQCHASETFATTDHQLHSPLDANCIDCHMPSTTYMQVDPRNDHSFRIPRPDLTRDHGVPNACNNCHTDKSASWAVDVLRQNDRLPSPEDDLHWSALLASTERLDANSMDTLAKLAAEPTVPTLVRASAVSRMQFGDSPASRELLGNLTQDPDPLLRWGVARALQNSAPSLVAHLAPPLLKDPALSVRIAAANALVNVDPVLLPAGSHADLQAGLTEYIDVQMVNAERPESHVNIGNVQRLQGRYELAESSYLTAIRLNPSFVPSYVNLADLYRETSREQDAEKIIRRGLAVEADQPSLHHSLGLSLIRQQRLDEAMPELAAAADSAGSTARYALVYAVALNSQGRSAEAISVLQSALQRFENDPELENALNEFKAQR